MTPEETTAQQQKIIEQVSSAKQYIIDCHEPTEEGVFAFLAVTQGPEGEVGVVPVAYIAVAPPHPEAEILGFIWEGSPEAGAEWVAKNQQYLDKLNFVKA